MLNCEQVEEVDKEFTDSNCLEFVRIPKCDVKLNRRVKVSNDSTTKSKEENDVTDQFPTHSDISLFKPTKEQMRIARSG